MARTANEAGGFRVGVVAALVLVVMTPVGLILYQSFLDNPFFDSTARLSLEAYEYVIGDADYWRALGTTLVFALGLVAVAVPIGALLAFVLTRTDLAGKKWLEPVVLAPMFLSSIVLAFGYTVSVGPSGFVSLWVKQIFGGVPWNIYSLAGMIMIGGLSHAPGVYLYVSSAMRSLPSDLEEAARATGAGIWRVLLDVTLPMVLPSLIFAAALNLLLGFETFGIPLVLGDPGGIVVLTTYLYKVNGLFGTPTYHVMAVVAVSLVLMTLPLVFVQRLLLRNSRRYAALGGKGARATPLRLGGAGQVIAWSVIGFWLLVSVGLPLGGIAVRAFVDAWGEGVTLSEHLTTRHFLHLFDTPSLLRGIVNTLVISIAGGALAIFVYLVVALAGHRNKNISGAILDYMVLLPRALPGIIIGLAFFWVFLFIPFLKPLRLTLVSLFIAYTIVGLSYGLRIIQATLLQVAPELEEASRTTGAGVFRTWRDTLIPLVRPGLVGAWSLIMIIFLREYATGVYLMGVGTEVMGSLMVSMLTSGNMDQIAAMAFISVVLTAAGLGLALRLGARLHD